jgi:hypothetical protein
MKSRELAVPGTAGLGEDIVRREAVGGGHEAAPGLFDRLPADRPGRALAPLGLVAVAVAFNLWVLRAEVLPALNLNDSAVHLSMVRWAIDRMSGGHLPFDGWYPYLGLGSGLFHHYQSLPHILTGAMGLAVGPDRAFFGALYVLVATWPISVYLGARLMGWERWSAAGAAALSPLLASTPKYGYEHHSYVWWGYGLWSQAWAMWLLPLAWGCTWRTVSGHRPARYVIAVLLVGLTAACHFLTGYLAFLALGVWVLIRPGQLRTRIWRAAVVGVSALLLIAWVVVPALLDSGWASQSHFRQGTKLFDSVGAPKVFAWLFTGQLFDAGRLPIVTLLVLVGTVVCIARFRRDERARALLGVMALSLVLFSGRRTFGFLIQFLPGSDDLLLHRFIMGVQLAGLFLAGVGAAWIVVNATAAIRDRTPTVAPAVRTAVVAILGLCVLAPAWIDRAQTDLEWGGLLREQRATDAAQATAVRTLIADAEAQGPGRIYAGTSVNWGRRERLVHVPLFAILLAEDADGIGFVLRTTSLSSDFEAAFDETDPAQYELFGIRYLLLPPEHEPPVAATLVSERAGYTLWELDTGGYIDVVDTTGPPIAADRVDIFDRATWFLTSPLLREGRYPTVAFAGAPAAEPSLAEGSAPEGPAGVVIDEQDALTDGEFSADVSAARPAVALLRSSFEPRWEATVDGEPVTPQMVAPSFVGVPVPAGTHHVEFRYRSFPRYDLLFAIGAATLLALWLVPWAVARSRAKRRSTDPDR